MLRFPALAAAVRGVLTQIIPAVLLAMKCVFALVFLVDIHSVSPHFGAANGGTLLTIKGRGFGNNPSLVAVDIDGTPCTVVSVAMDTLTCRTTAPPADSRAIVDDVSDGANVTLDGVVDGYRFIGMCACELLMSQGIFSYVIHQSNKPIIM